MRRRRKPGAKRGSPFQAVRRVFVIPRKRQAKLPWTVGFTMIELMMVVAIMGIVMTMGVPAIYHIWHKESLTKSVSDILEVCSHARARAILHGQMAEVVFHPQDRRLEVAGAGNGEGLSAQIPEQVVIEMLDVNLTEYKDAEIARVRFYPNGMCDEMTLILHSAQNEWRKISLEISTSLATVEDVR
jgi:prepilin-type N-terminal cleavage/methylation domain-containing protein